jgi:general transcription factor 3C polypeptide 3 (transcription factor C subunit 4)
MTFLFDYYDLKCGKPDGKGKEKEVKWDEIQEAEYNVGRAFHHIGKLHPPPLLPPRLH